MKVKFCAATLSMVGWLAAVSAAQAQGSSGGTTSGPAAGGNVQPSTHQDASGVPGPVGSKNGPPAKTSSSTRQPGDVGSPAGGVASGAAGVAGAPGSKSGPAQRSGSSSQK